MRRPLAAATAALALLAAAAPAFARPEESPDERKAIVEAFIKEADELIYDKTYDSAAGRHYKVKTDDPRFLPKKAADLLDHFRAFFDDYWKGKIELKPYDAIGRIYLFYSRAKYKKLFDETHQSEAEWSVGHYRDYFDVMAAHTDTVGLEDMPDVLVHEAAHQLVQQRLFGPGSLSWPWLDEGLAGYFGSMARDSKGTYQPDKIGDKGVWLFKEARQSGGDRARREAALLARMIREKKARPVDEIIRVEDGQDFYSGGLERTLPSWMLVHFLLHGDKGAHTSGFVRFLAREAKGEETTAEDLYKEIGMTIEQLQKAFEDYARKKG